jgi:hypothetical protein
MKQQWKKFYDEKTLEKMIKFMAYECQIKTNKDETKICASSIEDIIDFSTFLFKPNITVRQQIMETVQTRMPCGSC